MFPYARAEDPNRVEVCAAEGKGLFADFFSFVAGCRRPEGVVGSLACDGQDRHRRVRPGSKQDHVWGLDNRMGAENHRPHGTGCGVALRCAAVAAGAAADPGVQEKRAQAQAIMAELEELDMSLAATIESYNYANVELDRIDSDLGVNARHLVAARKSLNVAQRRISERLRDLYVNGDGDSTLEVLLGSKSLDDIVARLDAIQRVSSQDTRILAEVKEFRHEVETRRANLKDARVEQAQVVAERAAQRRDRSKVASPSGRSYWPRSRTRSSKCRRKSDVARLSWRNRRVLASRQSAWLSSRRSTRRTS